MAQWLQEMIWLSGFRDDLAKWFQRLFGLVASEKIWFSGFRGDDLA